jgi:hypothetical protein
MAVETQFDFEQGEYQRALQAVMRYNPARRLIPLMGIVIPGLGLWFAVGSRWNAMTPWLRFQNALPWLVLGAFYLALMPMWIRAAAKKAQENDPALRGPQTRILDTTGLHVRGASFSQDFAWADIAKAVETPDFFLLFYNKRMAHYLPKSRLSPKAVAEARALIETHVPAKYLRERAVSISV